MNTKLTPLVFAILVASSTSLISCDKAQVANDYDYAEKSVASVETEELAKEKVATAPLANMEMEESKATAVEDEQSASHKLESKAVNQQVADKKFVVNASAEFTVADVVDSVNIIEDLTKKNQGFIEFSHIDNTLISNEDVVRSEIIIRLSRYVRSAKMTVRIPKENVGQFLKQLQKQVKFLQTSEFIAKDVTLDIYRQQLESQISGEKVEELEEQRLDAKKAKEQASNVETIDKTYESKVQQALAELEKKAIEDKIKYSTIELSFSQPENIYQKTITNTQTLVNNYQPNFQVQLQDSVQTGWLAFKSIILGLAKGWWIGLLIILSVPAWQLLRFFWRVTARMFAPKKESKKPSNNSNKIKAKAENKPLTQEVKTEEKKTAESAKITLEPVEKNTETEKAKVEPVKTVEIIENKATKVDTEETKPAEKAKIEVEPPKTQTVPIPPPLPKDKEKETDNKTEEKKSDDEKKEDKKD